MRSVGCPNRRSQAHSPIENPKKILIVRRYIQAEIRKTAKNILSAPIFMKARKISPNGECTINAKATRKKQLRETRIRLSIRTAMKDHKIS